MALSVLVCGVFAACSSKKTDGQNSAADTTQAGLANADTQFGTEINKDGKEVDVVLMKKDKKGKTVAYEIDKNGEEVMTRTAKKLPFPSGRPPPKISKPLRVEKQRWQRRNAHLRAHHAPNHRQ